MKQFLVTCLLISLVFSQNYDNINTQSEATVSFQNNNLPIPDEIFPQTTENAFPPQIAPDYKQENIESQSGQTSPGFPGQNQAQTRNFPNNIKPNYEPAIGTNSVQNQNQNVRNNQDFPNRPHPYPYSNHSNGTHPHPRPHPHPNQTYSGFDTPLTIEEAMMYAQSEGRGPRHEKGQEEHHQKHNKHCRHQEQKGVEQDMELQQQYNGEKEYQPKEKDNHHKKGKCFWKRLDPEAKILIIGLFVLFIVMTVKFVRLRRRLRRMQSQQQQPQQQQAPVIVNPVQIPNNAVRVSVPAQQDYVQLNSSNSLQNTMQVIQPQSVELQQIRNQNENQQVRQVYPQIHLGQPILLNYPQAQFQQQQQ